MTLNRNGAARRAEENSPDAGVLRGLLTLKFDMVTWPFLTIDMRHGHFLKSTCDIGEYK